MAGERLIQSRDARLQAFISDLAVRAGVDPEQAILDISSQLEQLPESVDVAHVTVDWLKNLETQIRESNYEFVYRGKITIAGAKMDSLRPIADDRGYVIERFSAPWIRAKGLQIPQHTYTSGTLEGVTKAWHLHAVHTDQFTVDKDVLQVVLVDVREGSQTFGHVNSVVMGIRNPSLLVIPPGVMHGWKAIRGAEVDVTNFQTETYDAADELKFPPDGFLPEIWGPKNG